MNEVLAEKNLDITAIREAVITCGFYFVVFLAAVVLDGFYPDRTALTLAVVISPYLLVPAFILLRRSMRAPWFPVGDAIDTLLRLALVWAILGLLALIFAFENGLGTPLLPIGELTRIAAVVGAPLAEELVFRGALLTSLSRMQLGTTQILKVPISVVVVGAVAYSVVHFFVFLPAGFSFSDAITSSALALIMGLAFGVIYLRTQNIWYGVFLHMLINLAQWS